MRHTSAPVLRLRSPLPEPWGADLSAVDDGDYCNEDPYRGGEREGKGQEVRSCYLQRVENRSRQTPRALPQSHD
jgi:hypothetical protein